MPVKNIFPKKRTGYHKVWFAHDIMDFITIKEMEEQIAKQKKAGATIITFQEGSTTSGKHHINIRFENVKGVELWHKLNPQADLNSLTFIEAELERALVAQHEEINQALLNTRNLIKKLKENTKQS